ncbi:MAG: hypothetical protein COA33_000770 [Fluviicola sp.]|nr:hypothetical protein [Fluviicola sp.]
MEKKEFDIQINKILEQVYHKPIESVDHIVKRAIIETEYRYIKYLEDKGLIKRLKNVSGGGKFAVQLENEGYLVFEEYNGWFDYKSKVLDKKIKLNRAKELAVKFWWIPLLISFISIGISIVALMKSK